MQRRALALLIIFFPIIGFSQNFKGGLLAGMSATQVDGDSYGGYNRAGLVAGIWVSKNILHEFTLRTELKFIQKGSYKRFIDDLGGTTGFYSLRLNYAEMPFLVEYHFRDDVVPFAGVSFGYLWKAIEKNADGVYPEDEVALFRKLEFTGIGGVEYFINKTFSVCASISYSAFPVRPHTGNISYRWDRGQYNNVLQFYLRYHY